MRHISYYTWKTLRKNLVFITIFSSQVIIVALFTFFASIQMAGVIDYKQTTEKLKPFNLVHFKTYYGTDYAIYTPEMNKQLMYLLDKQQQAYSSIDSIRLPEYPDIPVIIGIGGFGHVYSISDTTNQLPVAYIGKDVSDIHVGDQVTFGASVRQSLTISHQLKDHLSYMRYQTPVDLDESIIILTTYSQFMESYGANDLEQIVTNTVLIDPSSERIKQFIDVMTQSDFFNFSPVYWNFQAPFAYKELLNSSLFFIIFFFITMLFIFMGLIGNLFRMIDQNIRQYAIHRMYGASGIGIASQMLLYVTIVLLIPLSLSYSIIQAVDPEGIPLYIFASFLVISISIVVTPALRYVKCTSVTELMKRDES
jgi:hypothetical protein